MYLKNFDDIKKTSVFFILKPVNAIYGFIVTICISFAVIIIWSVFSPMDDVVKAEVLLRPSEVVSSVKCVTSGQLYLKNFLNNDIVQEGDLLFSLDITSQQSEREALKTILLQTEQEINSNKYLLQTIKTSNLPQIDKTSEEYINSNDYYLENQKYQKQILEVQIKLEREENQSEMLIIQQNIDDLKLSLEQIKLSYENWKNNKLLNAIEKETSLQQTKNNLLVQIQHIDRTIKNATIYAPISGKISEVTKLNIGDYLLSGEEVLKIVPQNEERLKVDIYVDPSYIARIKEKNQVKIKFPGLPPSRYGMVETEISLIPPDITNINGSYVFVAEAYVDSPYLYTKNGKSAKLIPGITGEARIITDKSTVLQMVLRKLDFIN